MDSKAADADATVVDFRGWCIALPPAPGRNLHRQSAGTIAAGRYTLPQSIQASLLCCCGSPTTGVSALPALTAEDNAHTRRSARRLHRVNLGF